VITWTSGDTERPPVVKSDEKLFRILELLLEKGEAGVTELADETPYHKSTVYTHLKTMREKGLVFKSDGDYRLSLRFLTISERIKTQRPVYEHGHNEIDSLAKETGELAYLAVPENDVVAILHHARGEKATLSVTVGSQVPIGEHPAGKALLAFRSDPDAAEADDPTERDPSVDVFVGSDGDRSAELRQARTEGFVVSTDHSGDGPSIAEPDRSGPRSESHLTEIRNRTVAAPVLREDDPVAAVAITGSGKRISGDYQEAISQQVVRTAAAIERKLDVEQAVPTAEDG